MYAHGYRASYGNVLGARATVVAVAVEVVAVARVRALLAPAQICVLRAGDCEGCEHPQGDSHVLSPSGESFGDRGWVAQAPATQNDADRRTTTMHLRPPRSSQIHRETAWCLNSRALSARRLLPKLGGGVAQYNMKHRVGLHAVWICMPNQKMQTLHRHKPWIVTFGK